MQQAMGATCRSHCVVCFDEVARVGAHVAIGAQLRRAHCAFLAVCAQPALCPRFAGEDQALNEPMQALPAVAT